MKHTKAKDTRQCDWCRKAGVKRRATWHHQGQCACDEHKPLIKPDDGHMTEGDYQSWYRL